MENDTDNRHPATDTLLDYLDKRCSSEHSQHIRQCVHCLNEVVQISESRSRLQQLPQVQAPAHLWANIQQEIQPPAQTRKSNTKHFQWMATAASIVLVATLFVLNPLQTTHQVPVATTGENSEYLALLQESQQLESALSYLDRKPSIINLSTAGQISQYQDSIATIDLALIESSQNSKNHEFRNTLMKERIHLMQQLVKFKAKPLTDKYQTF